MTQRRSDLERFTDRVTDYIAYRPNYPGELLRFFQQELGLTRKHAVADVGSGTGILAELFLENGNTVYGVEPNQAMREAAEVLLVDYDRFHSVAGTAEATELEVGLVDFVVAGQSFHWFDPQAARTEFRRILGSGGWVALVWNSRRTEGTPFSTAYEAFLRRWGTDYQQISGRYGAKGPLITFFSSAPFERRSFPNRQILDHAGLRGRLLSSSYIPGPDDTAYQPMLEALRELFDDQEQGGVVVMEYDTEVFFGRLDGE